jgi:hypothetical protein
MKKLNLRSRADLVRHAVKHGWFSSEPRSVEDVEATTVSR